MGLKRLYLNISTYSYSYTVTISKKEKKEAMNLKKSGESYMGGKMGRSIIIVSQVRNVQIPQRMNKNLTAIYILF